MMIMIKIGFGTNICLKVPKKVPKPNAQNLIPKPTMATKQKSRIGMKDQNKHNIRQSLKAGKTDLT